MDRRHFLATVAGAALAVTSQAAIPVEVLPPRRIAIRHIVRCRYTIWDLYGKLTEEEAYIYLCAHWKMGRMLTSPTLTPGVIALWIGKPDGEAFKEWLRTHDNIKLETKSWDV